jgi:hypothetical protein
MAGDAVVASLSRPCSQISKEFNIMSKNKFVTRPRKPSKPVLRVKVRIRDQSTINLLSRSMAGLSPSRKAAKMATILRIGLLESLKVERLVCARVIVDDTGVRPLRLEWFPRTFQSLSEICDFALICRVGEPHDEPGACLAIRKCLPVVQQHQDLDLDLAAFGYEGDPDEDDWEVAAFATVEMLKLRDGGHISVAEFHADPRAYLLA